MGMTGFLMQLWVEKITVLMQLHLLCESMDKYASYYRISWYRYIIKNSWVLYQYVGPLKSRFTCDKCEQGSIWDESVGSEVPKAMGTKSPILWDITLCSPMKVNRDFQRTRRLHLQGLKIRWAACYLLHAGFLLGLFFNPVDGGNMFF
jgi:hypothetical protein